MKERPQPEPMVRGLSAMVDQRFSEHHLREARKWFERLPADSHGDLAEILSLPRNRSQAREAHEYLKRFFSNAEKHGWNNYHTALALNVLAQTGGPNLEAGKIDRFKHFVRAFDYLGLWTKVVARPAESEEDVLKVGLAPEADRLQRGILLVSKAIDETGARHVNAAARLLEGKDHSIYPLRIYFAARTRRLVGPKTTDSYLRGKESNIFKPCNELLDRFILKLEAENLPTRQMMAQHENAQLLRKDLSHWRNAAKRLQ